MDTPLKTVKIPATIWEQGRLEALRYAHNMLWAQIEAAVSEGWDLPEETRSLKLVILASPDRADPLNLPTSPPSDV